MTPVVCLITDRARMGGDVDAIVRRVAMAARAGVHLVQVRERDLEAGPLTSLVRRCVDVVRGTRTRVLVNDRVDVALAAGAHGVHLRADSPPARRVRAICPPGFLVGRSVHGAAESASVAQDGGVDYLLFGTVFHTASKPGREAAGLERLAETCARVPVPVLAVGGVTPDNLRGVATAGAAGFAAIGLFADSPEHRLPEIVRGAVAAYVPAAG